MVKSKKVKAKYEMVLNVNNQQYKSQGDTILQAMEGLPKILDIFPIKTKAVISIKGGDRQGEFPMAPIALRRLLNTPFAKKLWEKKFEMLIK